MKTYQKGLYTLANDNVIDQLIALLNSIEVNYSKDIPVCIIPYDDNIDLVKKEISKRKNVFLFEDKKSIRRWEEFAKTVWNLYPEKDKNIFGRHHLTIHRKFCVFDGPFDKFIFLDADTLVMRSLDFVFEKLNQNDFVFYDFQYKDPGHVYNIDSKKLLKIFNQKRINYEIFCVGFFGSKKELLSEKQKEFLLFKLEQGENEILYPKAPEQSLLNYMLMKINKKMYNFALNLSQDKITGNCVVSKHFKEKNHILYDKGNRLTYLHYIGLSSELFKKVYLEENIDFPYRNIFLYYRYLNEPEKMPKFKGKAKSYNSPPSLTKRILRKISSLI